MNKRVFITGGANGIGKALVLAFAADSHQIAFCDTDENAGRELEKQTGA